MRRGPQVQDRPVASYRVLLLIAAIGGGVWVSWYERARCTTATVVPEATAKSTNNIIEPVLEPAPSGSSMPPGIDDSILEAHGHVVARRQATVSAVIIGKISEVLISEGSRVRQGEILARLDDGAQLLALKSATAQLDAEKARLHAAEVFYADAEPIYRRTSQTRSGGFISAQDYDAAKATYDTAANNLDVERHAVAVAQATVDVAVRNLSDTVIRAPFSGVVTYKGAQPGEVVSPQTGGGGFTRTGIGTIVDMDSLEVEVDVNETLINRVSPDRPVTIRLNAYPDWAIPGRVIAIMPTVDPTKSSVRVRLGFEQHDPRILPEMGALVAFQP
jgi:HlyD family secretion protein